MTDPSDLARMRCGHCGRFFRSIDPHVCEDTDVMSKPPGLLEFDEGDFVIAVDVGSARPITLVPFVSDALVRYAEHSTACTNVSLRGWASEVGLVEVDVYVGEDEP